jgi:hypothetical protein
MDLFTHEDLRDVLTERQGPCVSLFMPAHRGGSEQDPICFRRLLEGAADRLVLAGLRSAEARELLGPARELLDTPLFWKNQCDGLALFLAPAFLRLYRLPLTLESQVAAGRRFRIAPLLPLLSGDGRFYLLALSENGVRLLQGTRRTTSEVDLSGVPTSLAEALRAHDRDEPLQFHTQPAQGWGRRGAIFHGQGVGIDNKKDDLLLFFQRVNRGLHAVLEADWVPLVLAAVGELMPLYRQANTYPHLLDRGVEGSPDRLSARELHDRAWPLVEPLFHKAREEALARYRQLAGTGRTASDVAAVLPAACRGEVETLFVARDEKCRGLFDPASGRVEEHAREEVGDDDLLDLAASQTLRHGGGTYALARSQMPDAALLAAIFHLPLARHGKRP